MLKNFLGIIILLNLLSSVSFAEPSKEIQFLMNEPASLFDLGMFRLNKRLENMSGNISGFASYDVTENRIKVTGMYGKREKKSKAMDSCTHIIKILRLKFGISMLDGKRLGDSIIEDSSSMISKFSHEGYYNKKQTKAISDELENITEIHGVVYTKKGESVRCKGDLVGTEISIINYK